MLLKKCLTLMLSIGLIVTTINAQDAIQVKKGQVVPFDGFLVTRQTVDNIQKDMENLKHTIEDQSIDIDSLTAENKYLKEDRELLVKERDLTKKQYELQLSTIDNIEKLNEKLNKEMKWIRVEREIYRWVGMISLGGLIGLSIGFGINYATTK